MGDFSDLCEMFLFQGPDGDAGKPGSSGLPGIPGNDVSVTFWFDIYL